MKSKGYFLAMAAMLAAVNQEFTVKTGGSNSVEPVEDAGNRFKVTVEKGKEALHTPCPSGCKTYFFRENGEFEFGRMKKDECFFVCHASNDRNAIRKFNKFKS